MSIVITHAGTERQAADRALAWVGRICDELQRRRRPGLAVRPSHC